MSIHGALQDLQIMLTDNQLYGRQAVIRHAER